TTHPPIKLSLQTTNKMTLIIIVKVLRVAGVVSTQSPPITTASPPATLPSSTSTEARNSNQAIPTSNLPLTSNSSASTQRPRFLAHHSGSIIDCHNPIFSYTLHLIIFIIINIKTNTPPPIYAPDPQCHRFLASDPRHGGQIFDCDNRPVRRQPLRQ